MKIVACIKQVPDTEAVVKWDIPKGILNREGMDSITNPFDEFALEEALLTKENYDGEIVAISMGPEKAADVLRNALALTLSAAEPLRAARRSMGAVRRRLRDFRRPPQVHSADLTPRHLDRKKLQMGARVQPPPCPDSSLRGRNGFCGRIMRGMCIILF